MTLESFKYKQALQKNDKGYKGIKLYFYINKLIHKELLAENWRHISAWCAVCLLTENGPKAAKIQRKALSVLLRSLEKYSWRLFKDIPWCCTLLWISAHLSALVEAALAAVNLGKQQKTTKYINLIGGGGGGYVVHLCQNIITRGKTINGARTKVISQVHLFLHL